MNEEPDSTDVIGQLLGKGQRFPGEMSKPLTQGVVQTFDVAGLASAFGDDPMTLARQDAHVRLPIIGVTDGTLMVDRWHLRPEGFGTFSAAIPDMDGDHCAGVGVQGQPHPDFVAALPDKAPEFITLQGQTPFF